MSEGSSTPEIEIPNNTPVYGVENIGNIKPEHPSKRKAHTVNESPKKQGKIIQIPNAK